MFQFLKEVPSASVYCFPGLCSSSVSWVVGGGGGGGKGLLPGYWVTGEGYIWQTGGRSTGFPFSPPPFACLLPPFDLTAIKLDMRATSTQQIPVFMGCWYSIFIKL